MESLRETTHSVLAQLTPREAKVLRMRFGIDMNTDHTLEEVGKQFDVTRERIRQIEAKALRKLRHPSRSRSSCAASSSKTEQPTSGRQRKKAAPSLKKTRPFSLQRRSSVQPSTCSQRLQCRGARHFRYLGVVRHVSAMLAIQATHRGDRGACAGQRTTVEARRLASAMPAMVAAHADDVIARFVELPEQQAEQP